jgi:hypothetical protein
MRMGRGASRCIDGYISTPEGQPVLLSMPTFAGRTSHGLPEFLAGCRGALMGRTTSCRRSTRRNGPGRGCAYSS